MSTSIELREIAVRHGRSKKRWNAIAAVLCGAVPALLVKVYSASGAGWRLGLLGVVAGLLWGNGFEYVYHRWLLHRPRSASGSAHQEHHSRIGAPDEAEYVALIASPLNIVVLFVVNGVPAFLIASLTGLWGIFAGVFIGWSMYLVVTEEVHWRVHMSGWLPPGFRFARGYHMSHHDVPISRYNVFLPLFDFLFGSVGSGRNKVPVQSAGN